MGIRVSMRKPMSPRRGGFANGWTRALCKLSPYLSQTKLLECARATGARAERVPHHAIPPRRAHPRTAHTTRCARLSLADSSLSPSVPGCALPAYAARARARRTPSALAAAVDTRTLCKESLRFRLPLPHRPRCTLPMRGVRRRGRAHMLTACPWLAPSIRGRSTTHTHKSAIGRTPEYPLICAARVPRARADARAFPAAAWSSARRACPSRTGP